MTELPTLNLSAQEILEAAGDLAQTITANRRAIHANPELGLDNPQTQARIVAELERIGVDRLVRGRGCSSVVADIVGGGSGPGTGRTVALRADTDALPMTENNSLPFASRHRGRMHACGHDSHVAMLLGAAELLAARRDGFAGTVRLLFQPGEEGYGGARIMIEEGALDGVDAAFAIHVDSSTPVGVLALRTGAIMASTDEFEVTFEGAGGHASMPHFTRDPIPAIGPFVDGLSHVAARETDPDDRAVFSVTKVAAGSAFNVVPPTAELCGTFRCLSPGRRVRAREQVRRVAEGVAAARGVGVSMHFHEGYPPTVNHDAPVQTIAAVAEDLGLRVHWMPSPMMGAEDFSYILEKVPGAIVFLGVRVPDGGPLHSDLMKLDESAMPSGAALHAAVAQALLATDAAG